MISGRMDVKCLILKYFIHYSEDFHLVRYIHSKDRKGTIKIRGNIKNWAFLSALGILLSKVSSSTKEDEGGDLEMACATHGICRCSLLRCRNVLIKTLISHPVARMMNPDLHMEESPPFLLKLLMESLNS